MVLSRIVYALVGVSTFVCIGFLFLQLDYKSNDRFIKKTPLNPYYSTEFSEETDLKEDMKDQK